MIFNRDKNIKLYLRKNVRILSITKIILLHMAYYAIINHISDNISLTKFTNNIKILNRKIYLFKKRMESE